MLADENKAVVRRYMEEIINGAYYAVVEELIAEGDLVIDRFTIRATQTGSANGVAASGRRIETLRMHMWRLAGGKLLER